MYTCHNITLFIIITTLIAAMTGHFIKTIAKQSMTNAYTDFPIVSYNLKHYNNTSVMKDLKSTVIVNSKKPVQDIFFTLI